MTTRSLLLTGIAAFVAGIITFLPLSLVVPASGTGGVRYTSVNGTLWGGGEITGLNIRGFPAGRAHISPHPFALFTGGDISLHGPYAEGSAELSANDGLALADTNLSLDLAGLQLPLPLVGQLTLKDGTASFHDGRCSAATGEARLVAHLESAKGAGILPPLSGQVGCEAGEMTLRLSGQADGTSLGLAAFLSPDGHYRVTANLSTASPDVRRLLPFMGFEAEGNGFKLNLKGNW